MELHTVSIDKPEDLNLILGQAHFIKAVEDIVVDEAFDFTEKILKSQREFASSLLDDVLGTSSSKPTRAPKRAPAKPAARRTVHKATKHAGAA